MKNAYSYAAPIPNSDLFVVKLPMKLWSIADGRGANFEQSDSWHLPIGFESKESAEKAASTMPHVWFSLDVDSDMARHCLKLGGFLLPEHAR